MTSKSAQQLQTFTPAALSAARVGTWEYDIVSDRMRCDATMAALYGLTAGEGEAGVPIARTLSAIHPDDCVHQRTEFRRVLQHGGLFVSEYRTHPSPGDTRWVLVRGSIETDDHGRMAFGRGIAVDMTESK